MITIRRLINNNPVFAELTDAIKREIASRAVCHDYHPGEIITFAGDIWPHLFIVSQGEVIAMKSSSEGRRLVIAVFTPGELFWGLAFFQENSLMPVTLEAIGECQLFTWSRERLLPIVLKESRLTWGLCELMAKRMSRASDIIDEQVFKPVASRLARLLLDSFETAGGLQVSRYMTLEDMAARIGTTREMVCRVLYQFSGHKLIDITRTEFSLLQKDKLQELAKLD